MKRIKNILFAYWPAYIVNAVTYLLINIKWTPIKLLPAGVAFNWILLSIILLIFENNNHGRFVI